MNLTETDRWTLLNALQLATQRSFDSATAVRGASIELAEAFERDAKKYSAMRDLVEHAATITVD